MAFVWLIALLAVVSVLTSTKAGRAEASEKLKKYNTLLYSITAVLWIIMLSGLFY